MREEQKKVIQKEMDKTRAFRHYSERTDQLQLTGCLSKTKTPKFITKFAVTFVY